ncbi:MAG: hypothetical protein AAF764_01250 [Pseudomonadota bacterium]
MLPARCLAIFLAGLLALVVFQSSAMVTTSYDLPENAMSERIVMAAETWHGWMEAMGTAGVTEAISDTLEEWHEVPITDA